MGGGFVGGWGIGDREGVGGEVSILMLGVRLGPLLLGEGMVVG